VAETHQLTELQLAIMRVIWAKGEATVQDIWEALHADRGLAQTTVATMLSRLERRGVVTRRAESRQFHYRAAVTEQEVLATGLTLEEIRSKSFVKIMAARRAK